MIAENEHRHERRIVAQNLLGTTADNDKRVAVGGFAADEIKLHLRDVVLRRAAVTFDGAVEQAVARQLIVLFEVRYIDVFAGDDLLQQVIVEQRQFKTLGEHFGHQVTAAAEFAADGNNQLFAHGYVRSFLSLNQAVTD